MVQLPKEVADQVKHYVYALRDPRTQEVFYVGKGVGSRINSHLIEAHKNPGSERAKLARIHDIEASGLEVDLLFLRTGLPDDETALIVEQSVIDAFGAGKQELTNLVRGHHASSHGLASLTEVVARYRALPCPQIEGPVIMLKIQNEWQPGMNAEDIYEKTRGHWRIAEWVRERMIGGIALGIAHGVVHGAYRIESWFMSEMPWDEGKNRWGFNGKDAIELSSIVGTQVRNAFPNQVMYRRFLDGYPGDAHI
ncbi:MAG: hypothetical protein J0H64_09990 [Actinobacteria bacterium]|nr:hypothetical protein [Actinomycetota bacterium]